VAAQGIAPVGAIDGPGSERDKEGRPMIRATLATAMMLTAATAGAETIEVQMLNRGEEGVMVFEPAYVDAAVGDVIRFVPTDPGHNAESIEGMLPEGVEPFKSRINQEFELELTEEGLYGVQCTPHYRMGMVALIQAGDPVNLEAARAVEHPGKAAERFPPLFERVE
jgi:pseudoazurin